MLGDIIKMKRIDIDDKKGVFEKDLYNIYLNKYNKDNNIKIQRAKSKIAEIMAKELTSKQFACVHMYYIENIKQVYIAKSLGVSQSTVSRNIKRGIERIKKYAQYLDLR